MRDLDARMHAAVGAPRSRSADFLSGDCGQCRLERILYRAAAGLGLPAEEATAVVLESENDPDRT
jgi:hypothetical protein